MAGYLLDAGVVSAIRSSGLRPADWVGSDDLAVPLVVVAEVFYDLQPTDTQAIGNAAVLACLPPPIAPTQDIADRARELREKYAAHQPELALNDSLIVATALVLDRIVITRNRRDFHYEAGLTWIDAEGFRPDQGPLLDSRAAVEAGPGPRHCCSRIR